MGRKISVDSATMMNKALEVIEAHELFRMPAHRIEVLIHPQSVIHSMVEYVDNSIVAQLGTPDMRVPISYGLSWPHRMPSSVPAFDWSQALGLHFEPLDWVRFPALQLAWHVLEAPFGTSTVLNAANEVAVDAFLLGRLGFSDVTRLNQLAIETCIFSSVMSWGDLYELDAKTRQWAQEQIAGWTR
jgi:1-deoxy-D-xylulose-5-phosphate reductoisomerase